MYETNYQMPVMSRKDQALRNFFSQPKFMWLGIIGLISAILSSFSGLFPAEPVDLSVFADLGIDPSSLEQSMTYSPSFSINIIPILTSVAFLLFHFNAKNPEKNFKAPSTILNVIAIIGFVLVCIASVFCILALILVSVFGFLNTASDEATLSAIIAGTLLFVVIFVFAILFLFTFLEMRFTKSLKISTTTPATSMKGVKGYGVIIMINGIFTALSALTAFVPTEFGFNIWAAFYTFVLAVIGTVYYFLQYQFISGFGKIIEAEETTRLFESAPYNQVPHSQVPVTGEAFYNQPPHSQTPVTGEAFDNQRPYYNNPYTTPQEAPAESTQPVCKQCGNPVNSDDYFCMKCGTRIERD